MLMQNNSSLPRRRESRKRANVVLIFSGFPSARERRKICWLFAIPLGLACTAAFAQSAPTGNWEDGVISGGILWGQGVLFKADSYKGMAVEVSWLEENYQ